MKEPIWQTLGYESHNFDYQTALSDRKLREYDQRSRSKIPMCDLAFEGSWYGAAKLHEKAGTRLEVLCLRGAGDPHWLARFTLWNYAEVDHNPTVDRWTPDGALTPARIAEVNAVERACRDLLLREGLLTRKQAKLLESHFRHDLVEDES